MIASISLATLSLCSTAADAAPWCARYGGRGGTNCGFYSYQQCMAAVSGTGGFCTPNQFETQQPRGDWRRYRRDY